MTVMQFTCSKLLVYLHVVITNGPMDVAECGRRRVRIPCGFTGAAAQTRSLNWRIIRRSDDGSIVSDETVNVDDILYDFDDGLQWVSDSTSTGNNAPNGLLYVGPLNVSHNQSSYQCLLNDAESSIGTLTVFGK